MLAPILALSSTGCGHGPLIRFLGSPSAADASVYVDGRLVGMFKQGVAIPTSIPDLPLGFEARISLRPEHEVMVVTVAGDTLRRTVMPDDSGAIFVDPASASIDYR